MNSIKSDHYSNREITVYWDQSKCVHAGVCYTQLRRVFNPLQRPWINMKGAETETIIAAVKKCPSGALSFAWNEEVEHNLAY